MDEIDRYIEATLMAAGLEIGSSPRKGEEHSYSLWRRLSEEELLNAGYDKPRDISQDIQIYQKGGIWYIENWHYVPGPGPEDFIKTFASLDLALNFAVDYLHRWRHDYSLVSAGRSQLAITAELNRDPGVVAIRFKQLQRANEAPYYTLEFDQRGHFDLPLFHRIGTPVPEDWPMLPKVIAEQASNRSPENRLKLWSRRPTPWKEAVDADSAAPLLRLLESISVPINAPDTDQSGWQGYTFTIWQGYNTFELKWRRLLPDEWMALDPILAELERLALRFLSSG